MHIKSYFLLSLSFLFLTQQSFSQEYLNDYIMKLDAISEDASYGYTEDKPIMVGGKKEGANNQLKFLSALLGPNGEKVRFSRVGSCCPVKSKNALVGDMGVLNKFQVTYSGLKKPIILFINGYDYDKNQVKCPKGFTYFTTETLPEIKKVDPDVIKKTTVCDASNKYTVKNSMLMERLGPDYKEPSKYPDYKGGLKKMKSYFEENPITDPRAKEMMFRVKIAFMINCNGEAGDYKIISRGKGELEELANLVLEKVNNLPSDWNPAKAKGDQVDCYQVLSFTVLSGQLNRVTFTTKK